MKFRVKHERLVGSEYEDVTDAETISGGEVIDWLDEKLQEVHEHLERLTIEVRK